MKYRFIRVSILAKRPRRIPIVDETNLASTLLHIGPLPRYVYAVVLRPSNVNNNRFRHNWHT